jgi:hypothetical protein
MAWANTYTHALAIAADMFGSAILWANKTADVTISSVCGLELRREALGQKSATQRLVILGKVLNWIQPGHCEMAIAADMSRLETARTFLISIPAPKPELTS